MNKAKRIFETFRKKPEFGVVLALIVVWGIFAIMYPRFLGVESLTYMLSLSAELGIIAIGMSLLIISGEFDLSVGPVLGIAVYVMVYFSNIGIST